MDTLVSSTKVFKGYSWFSKLYPHAQNLRLLFQCAGAESLGEVASLSVERMLSLGQSVSHWAREREPSDDGIVWAPSPARVAVQLCTQVRPTVPQNERNVLHPAIV